MSAQDAVRSSGNTMSKERGVRRRSPGSSGAAAVVVIALASAVLSFVVVLLYEAFHIAHSVNEALLNASEIFHKSIPLGTIIAGALFGALVGGGIWFHSEGLAKCWQRISANLQRAWPVLRPLFATVAVVVVVAIGLLFFPKSGDTQQQKQRTAFSEPSKRTQESRQPLSVDPPMRDLPPPQRNLEGRLAEPTLPEWTPLIPIMRPRMAGRNVCDLFENPTDAEWNACELDNARHPKRIGTGGPVCVMIHGQVRCLQWPPKPKARPPLNILPELD